jgi:hypothetical protein
MQRQKKLILALALALAGALIGCQSPSAPTVTVFGLWPEQPPLRWNSSAAGGGADGNIWPRVNSIKPVLAWEAFPRPADLASDTNGLFARFKSVTYDLRIWSSKQQSDIVGELVYVRDALSEPLHQVETPLSRGSWYFWSVRARFELNGHIRVTEWSLVQSSDQVRNRTPEPAGVRYPDRRYFRFYVSGD